MPEPRWSALTWLADDRCTLDDISFVLTTADDGTPSTPANWRLLKTRPFLDSYRTLLGPIAPRRIVEVGFFHGAALALWDLLLQPAHLVGLDLVGSAPVLHHYLATHPASRVRPYFGIDQGQQARVTQILQDEFPAHNIDLLIDDASHLYGPTRATFAAAFPLLRPGGLYVIEDWGWAHWPGVWQAPTPLLPGPPLSQFLFELVMINATRPDVVQRLDIDLYRAAVVRGPAVLPPTPLALDTLFLARGHTLGWS